MNAANSVPELAMTEVFRPEVRAPKLLKNLS